MILDTKSLDEFEFGKSLIKIRNELYSSKGNDILDYILDNYDLSIKEIRRIIENRWTPMMNFLKNY